MGSRGSIIPLFLSLAKSGVLPITDERMTRFMITLEQGVDLVWHALNDMIGGEIYVNKIPSMKVVDIAKTLAPNASYKFVGIRPGEKMHEQMIGLEDSPFAYEYQNHYKILPAIHGWNNDPQRKKNGKLVVEGFTYTSENNSQWMDSAVLKRWVTETYQAINKD
jgi:FlaA1/EpsC-like NDP-sugar epimerase